MKEIDVLWLQIVHSADADTEAKHVEELSSYLKEHRIPFRTSFIDVQNNTHLYNEYSGPDDEIREVIVEFYTKEGPWRPKENWKPKEIQNLYLLFLE